ncbi:MAG: hypothetical protein ACK5JD_05805 [Mangrovibacterium sp.]
MKIIFLPEALDYFNELSAILYQKDYFGFEDSALRYVDELLDDIQTSLHFRPKYIAPSYFDRYGKEMYYCSFRRNKQTTWYIFFSIYQADNERVYLVRYISNNHVTGQFL